MPFCGHVLKPPQNTNCKNKTFLTKKEIKKVKNNLRENDTHRDVHIHIHYTKMTQCMWNGNPENENQNNMQNKCKKIFKFKNFKK